MLYIENPNKFNTENETCRSRERGGTRRNGAEARLVRIESRSAFLCDFLGELLAFDGRSDGVVGRRSRVRRVRRDRSGETGPSSGRGRRRLAIVFAFVESDIRHFRSERERERLSEVRTRGGFYVVAVERRILDFYNRGIFFFFFAFFLFLFIY